MAIEQFLKSLLIVSLSLPSYVSFAKVVTLGSSGKEVEFQKFLINSSGKKSLNSTLIQQQINKNSKLIEDKYKLAVKGLLLEDLKPSIFVLKEITGFSEKLIFNENSSKLVSESFFRLANLERLNANFWIKQGVYFNLDFKPSAQTFNPNIIKTFNKKNEEAQKFLYLQSSENLTDEHTKVFSNGQLVSGSFKVHPSHRYSLRLFKEGHQTKQVFLSGEELTKTKKIKMSKLKLGSCSNPNFIKYKGVQVDEIYFSKDCIKSRNTALGIVVAKNKSATKINSQKNTDYKRTPKDKSLFQKPSTWYVIGGVVLATVLISSLNSGGGSKKVKPVEL